jgi:hypothetical protein
MRSVQISDDQSKESTRTCWGTSQGASDAGQVWNDCLDAIAFAFDLGDETLHLVAVKGIADIATNVDERHVGGFGRRLYDRGDGK